MSIILPLPDHPRVFFGNHSLQNNIIQTTNLVDRAGQTFNTAVTTLARTDGGKITNVNKAPIEITMDCAITNSTGDGSQLTFRNQLEEFKRRIDYSDRYLRVMQKDSYQVVFAPTSDTSSVTLTNGTGLTSSTASPQILSHTHKFNGNGSDSITYETTFTAVDLSTKLATSNVEELPQWEVLIEIPKIEILDSVDIRIGTDSSKYYKLEGLASNYENLPLEQGKNIINLAHFVPDRTTSATLNLTEVGTVDDGSIGYLYVKFNLSENDSTEGYGVDGLIFSEDSQVRNFVSTPTGAVDIQGDFVNLISDFPGFTFVCPNAYSQGTQRETIINDTNNTDLTTDYDVFFHGNKLQLPRFELILNGITNLSNLEILNVVENQALRFNEGSESWAVNDRVVFDSQTKEITRNNQPQETTIGRLPIFNQGNQKIQFRVVQNNDVLINTNTNNVNSQTITQSTLDGVGQIAQSFVCTQTGTLSAIKVRIGNEDIPNPIMASIHTDSGGEPSLPPLAPSSNVYTGGLPAQDFTFNFNSAVTNGTTYWVSFFKTNISFNADITMTGSSSSTYASGESKIRDSSGNWISNSTLADLQVEITQSLPPSTDIDFRGSYIRTYQ